MVLPRLVVGPWMARPCAGRRTPPLVTPLLRRTLPPPRRRPRHGVAPWLALAPAPALSARRGPRPHRRRLPHPVTPVYWMEALARGHSSRLLPLPPVATPAPRAPPRNGCPDSSPRCLPRRSPVLLPQKLVQPPPSSVAASVTVPSPAPLAEASHVARGRLLLVAGTRSGVTEEVRRHQRRPRVVLPPPQCAQAGAPTAKLRLGAAGGHASARGAESRVVRFFLLSPSSCSPSAPPLRKEKGEHMGVDLIIFPGRAGFGSG
jgi:hypothetical protein